MTGKHGQVAAKSPGANGAGARSARSACRKDSPCPMPPPSLVFSAKMPAGNALKAVTTRLAPAGRHSPSRSANITTRLPTGLMPTTTSSARCSPGLSPTRRATTTRDKSRLPASPANGWNAARRSSRPCSPPFTATAKTATSTRAAACARPRRPCVCACSTPHCAPASAVSAI